MRHEHLLLTESVTSPQAARRGFPGRPGASKLQRHRHERRKVRELLRLAGGDEPE